MERSSWICRFKIRKSLTDARQKSGFLTTSIVCASLRRSGSHFHWQVQGNKTKAQKKPRWMVFCTFVLKICVCCSNSSNYTKFCFNSNEEKMFFHDVDLDHQNIYEQGFACCWRYMCSNGCPQLGMRNMTLQTLVLSCKFWSNLAIKSCHKGKLISAVLLIRKFSVYGFTNKIIQATTFCPSVIPIVNRPLQLGAKIYQRACKKRKHSGGNWFPIQSRHTR